ncbi:MAG TPA: glycosyltransferase family protein [Fibrobacteraceae bacterium]|nr:glycosyltransferase family protein [Fibrobacteraceae bacterium]
MATIFYSMAGEGRGHATRVKAVVEGLRGKHRIVLYAPGQAYELLEPWYRNSDVEVRSLNGLSFCYRSDGSLHYGRTLWESLRKFLGFPAQIQMIRRQMLVEKPELVITDFDPLLPRAAEQLGIPYLSIDHQHFLTAYNLDILPARHRWLALAMGIAVRCFYGSQIHTVVSSFYPAPLRKGVFQTTQVGILIGEDIRNARPRDDGFLLAYLRRDVPSRVVRALRKTGWKVRIYGLGSREPWENLEFLPVERKKFVHDLSHCGALLSTAGNQLVGEALFLGKPVLAMPERNNWEQEINGAFLEQLGGGWCIPMSSLCSKLILDFLKRRHEFVPKIPLESLCGNIPVLQIIEKTLQKISEGRKPWGAKALGRRSWFRRPLAGLLEIP